jgi:O-antigen ligase
MIATASSAALARCERDDPRGHAVHLAAAAAWGFFQSINNSLEGIAWGMLLAVAILRLPKIRRDLAPALRDPAWWLLLLWMAWMLLSVSWTHPEVDRLEALRPARWLLTPLLLWPVMGYPWLLLGAIAAGGLVQAVAAIGMSIGPDGLRTYSDMRSLTSYGQLQTVLGSLLAISAGAVAALPAGKANWRWPLLAAAAIAAFGILQSAARAPLLAGLAGMAILLVRPRRPHALRRLGLFAAAGAAAVAGLSLAGMGVPGAARLQEDLQRLSSDEAATAIMRSGAHRGTLLLASWDLGSQSPLVGHGRRSFSPLIREWTAERAAEQPELAEELRLVGELNHAHNSVVNAWVEGGLPAAALLTGGLAVLTLRVWRRSRTDAAAAAAMALLAIVLVGAMVGIAEAKAGGALIAVAMAISRRDPSGP